MVADAAPAPVSTADPDDDYLVALAYANAVDAIVSGDAHLLTSHTVSRCSPTSASGADSSSLPSCPRLGKQARRRLRSRPVLADARPRHGVGSLFRIDAMRDSGRGCGRLGSSSVTPDARPKQGGGRDAARVLLLDGSGSFLASDCEARRWVKRISSRVAIVGWLASSIRWAVTRQQRRGARGRG